MDNKQPTTREYILQSAYGLFYRQGFSRVSVDAIAESAGVTKRTVYYHFKSKDDIVGGVLTNQHQYMMRQYRQWVGQTSDDPRIIIDNLFLQLKRWADKPDWLGSGYTRITVELANMPGHPARIAASSHKREVENWLANQLESAGVKEAVRLARDMVILIEGCMSLALIHSDTEYINSARRAAGALVAATTATHDISSGGRSK